MEDDATALPFVGDFFLALDELNRLDDNDD